MSASMIRYASRTGQRLLRRHRHPESSVQTRSKIDVTDADVIDLEYVNDITVPYFPDAEKISSLQAKYPEVIISKEDFKYVKRILPCTAVPQLPTDIEYPTPSGWIPPIASKQPEEYGIGRTKNSMLPVYVKKHRDGRITTTVNKVYGDIHKLNEDLQKYLALHTNRKETRVQVHEVGNFLRYKGNHVTTIGKFCLEKGF